MHTQIDKKREIKPNNLGEQFLLYHRGAQCAQQEHDSSSSNNILQFFSARKKVKFVYFFFFFFKFSLFLYRRHVTKAFYDALMPNPTRRPPICVKEPHRSASDICTETMSASTY